jgi:hypothetical protein
VRGLTLADVEAELDRRHASPALPPSPERSSGEGRGMAEGQGGG